MRLFGSIVEILRIFFRKDGKKIEWKPNQSHTYSADMTYELPAPDSVANESDVLISEKAQQTLANKTLNFDTNASGNVASNIPLTALTSAAQATISGKAEQSALTALTSRVTTAENNIAARPVFYSTAWYNADGATKTITHNLNSLRIEVHVVDESNEHIYIDSVTPVGFNSCILTASIAPPVAWQVYYKKIQ